MTDTATTPAPTPGPAGAATETDRLRAEVERLTAERDALAADNARLRGMWADAGKRLKRQSDQLAAEGEWMATAIMRGARQ
jgi:hypothetical protein